MKEVMSAVWLHGLDINYLREQVGNPKDALSRFSFMIHWYNRMVSHQAAGQPLMRQVIRDYCQPVIEGGQLHGEALLANFKPRGYSECIVVAGGEDRK